MPRRPSLPLDSLSVERTSPVPLHRQVYDSVRSLVVQGLLAPESPLPPTRALAEHLGIGRNTVIAAYDQLLAEGFIEARPGSGTKVAALMRRPIAAENPAMPALRMSRRGETLSSQSQPARQPGKINLQPGVPESATFPFNAWAKLLVRNARKRTDDVLGYHKFAGHPRLRQAIAEYLAVARGVACTPEQVIVVTGAQAALDLASRSLLDMGDHAWMEEPGYLGARSALQACGARVWPLRVDREGWRLNDPQLPRPRAIYVTPSCQWPYCTIMRMEQRLQLLAIADRSEAWILEDDYDGEYRFRGRPAPALRGLDRSDRVIYIGSFGKTLFSSLRIGFLIVPRELADAFDRAISITGQFAPLLLQIALADFIMDGHFARHLRRMRLLYARRQKTFVDLCKDQLGDWLVVGENDAGMQTIGTFVKPFDDRQVTETVLKHGVLVHPVSINFCSDPPEHGLLLGFAALGEREMASAVARLRAAFVELDRARATR